MNWQMPTVILKTQEVHIALKKWDLLIKEKEFSPEKASENQVKEAREWYDSEHSEMEKTAAFEKLQEQFSEDMEYRRNLADIDNKYHKLVEFGKPVPEKFSSKIPSIEVR